MITCVSKAVRYPDRECGVVDCITGQFCGGYCKKHYQRLWRTGSPLGVESVSTYTRIRGGKEQTVTRRSRPNEISGWSRTPIYKVWTGMRRRCNEPKANNYRWYGAQGIKVCDEWDSSFFAFRDWAYANGYEVGKELDRENTAGPYSPENCRWVTKLQNLQGRRQYLEPELEAQVVALASSAGVPVYEYIRQAIIEKVARESAPSVRKTGRR